MLISPALALCRMLSAQHLACPRSTADVTAMARTESRWLPTTTIASLVGAATLLLSTACTSQPTTTPTQTMSSPAARKLRAPETLLGLPKSMDREGIGLAQRHLDKLKREVGPNQRHRLALREQGTGRRRCLDQRRIRHHHRPAGGHRARAAAVPHRLPRDGRRRGTGRHRTVRPWPSRRSLPNRLCLGRRSDAGGRGFPLVPTAGRPHHPISRSTQGRAEPAA